MIQAVVFLGNPGKEYEKTRHNLGWMLAEVFSQQNGFEWQKKFKGQFAQKNKADEKIFFLKPETYMNLSGTSVQTLVQFYQLTPAQLLVVHDELELDFGQVSFKKGGGAAGHNGLRSLISTLNTPDFYRFRLGIARPKHGDIASYVLSAFSKIEQGKLPDYLTEATNLLESCFRQGIETMEKQYPKKYLL